MVISQSCQITKSRKPCCWRSPAAKLGTHTPQRLTRTQFVIARSEATWRSRSRSSVACSNEIATLRSQ